MIIHLFGAEITVTRESDIDCMGAFYPEKNIIKISDMVTDQGEVLVHEVVEAIDEKLELRLDHNVITSISAAFYHFIRDNPILAAELIEGLDLSTADMEDFDG